MRTFKLIREVDISGVSGTGLVAQGVEFDNGRCAVSFISGPVSSVIAYNSIEDAIAIHGHGGHTKLVFEKQAEPALATPAELKVVAYEEGLQCLEGYISQLPGTMLLQQMIEVWFQDAREMEPKLSF